MTTKIDAQDFFFLVAIIIFAANNRIPNWLGWVAFGISLALILSEPIRRAHIENKKRDDGPSIDS